MVVSSPVGARSPRHTGRVEVADTSYHVTCFLLAEYIPMKQFAALAFSLRSY